MPELPEVETTRRGILPYSEGKVLREIVVRDHRLRWPVSEFLRAWQPSKLQSLERRAKYIVMRFDQGSILVHLGMSGSMRVVQHAEPVQKHDHIDLVFDDVRVRYNDPRRFGSMLWSENWQAHKLIRHLGPEPLSSDFHADYLYAASRTRKITVKQFVMDSSVVVGVGNIYANEALFLSGIHPKRACNKISKARYERLVGHIKEILSRAITQGGTTLRDFVGGDGKPGYFQQQLFVYGRKGKPCKTCGAELKELRLNGRSTVFCPECQR